MDKAQFEKGYTWAMRAMRTIGGLAILIAIGKEGKK